MILSDRTILELVNKGELVIEPFDVELVGPSSMDLRLGNEFLIFERSKIEVIDPRRPLENFTRRIFVEDGDYFIIHPGEFVLASTLEYIKLPDYIAARIEGRSSLARLGIVVHSTGGFVDAGFEGQLTLEMSNLNIVPIKLYPRMKVAQLAFLIQDKPSEIPYGKRRTSKYFKQRGPLPSKIYLDFIDEEELED